MIKNLSANDGKPDETDAILKSLRNALRGAGWTQARLAAKFEVGTATMNRWLHGKSITLSNLEDLCRVAGVTIAELAWSDRRADLDEQTITLGQEEALAEDPFLSLVLVLVINGWQPSGTGDGLGLSSDDLENYIGRLQRLALIDRLAGGKLRSRISAEHVWQRAPMRRQFDRYMKYLFFELDYAKPTTLFSAEIVKLSIVGIAQLRELLQRMRIELRSIEKRDRHNSVHPGEWFGLLAVARPLDFATIYADLR